MKQMNCVWVLFLGFLVLGFFKDVVRVFKGLVDGLGLVSTSGSIRF